MARSRIRLRRWIALGGSVFIAVLLTAALPRGQALAAPSQWSVTPSPDHGDSDNQFSAVSCVSASDCMAVGTYLDGSQDLAMAEHWNGTAWSLTTPVQPSNTTNVLRSVSCVSATFCVAAGDYFDAGNAALTLIETWNGSTWSMAS